MHLFLRRCSQNFASSAAKTKTPRVYFLSLVRSLLHLQLPPLTSSALPLLAHQLVADLEFTNIFKRFLFN